MTGLMLGCVLFSVILIPGCHGHGRLLVPPARSTMWREGFNTPIDYNDNQLNCGGFQVGTFQSKVILAHVYVWKL